MDVWLLETTISHFVTIDLASGMTSLSRFTNHKNPISRVQYLPTKTSNVLVPPFCGLANLTTMEIIYSVFWGRGNRKSPKSNQITLMVFIQPKQKNSQKNSTNLENSSNQPNPKPTNPNPQPLTVKPNHPTQPPPTVGPQPIQPPAFLRRI